MVFFTLDRPQCITIQDGVAIDKYVNLLQSYVAYFNFKRASFFSISGFQM